MRLSLQEFSLIPLSIVFTIAIIVLIFSGLCKSFALDEKLSQYNNLKYNISIQYPSDWHLKETMNNASKKSVTIATLSSNLFKSKLYNNTAGSVRISMAQLFSYYTLPKNLSSTHRSTIEQMMLNDYLRYRIDTNKKMYNQFQLISSKVNATGMPAYQLVYTTQRDNQTIKRMETGTIVGNKAYRIEYSTDIRVFPIYLPIVERMVSSFKITYK